MARDGRSWHNNHDGKGKPNGFSKRGPGRGKPRFEEDLAPAFGDFEQLISRLDGMDGRSYGSYKSVTGQWDYGDFVLHIDKVQSDPYAPPSLFRLEVPHSTTKIANELLDRPEKRLAAADFLARAFRQAITAAVGHKKRGPLSLAPLGQEILARTACQVTQLGVTVRFTCALPARGRTILGREAGDIADQLIPQIVEDALSNVQIEPLQEHIHCYLDYLALRQALRENNWVAFVAADSVLARQSGISDLPLPEATVVNVPATMSAQVELPYAGTVHGLAIKRGITLIVGGGYHGKSTLLNALERAVYPHIPGDGRELVATDPSAMKVRAEDGRAVTGVDISPFISNLPTGQDTSVFSTANASGSTSQAAAIIEALQAGSRTLLLDEDTSATNLLIRDQKMRRLVASEPITPLVDRVKQLSQIGISSLLVIGGTGEYLDVADQVIMLRDYQIFDATDQAKEIANSWPVAERQNSVVEGESAGENPFQNLRQRCPRSQKLDTGKGVKIKARRLDEVSIGVEEVDLSGLAQIVDPGQTIALGRVLRLCLEQVFDGHLSVAQVLTRVEKILNEQGLAALSPGLQLGTLVRPRPQEIAGIISRYRALVLATDNDAGPF